MQSDYQFQITHVSISLMIRYGGHYESVVFSFLSNDNIKSPKIILTIEHKTINTL